MERRPSLAGLIRNVHAASLLRGHHERFGWHKHSKAETALARETMMVSYTVIISILAMIDRTPSAFRMPCFETLFL